MYILFSMGKLLHAVLLAMMLMLAACSSDGEQSYKSSQEALDSYNKFLSDVRNAKVKSGSDVVALFRQWHTRRDSVASAIERDESVDKQQYMTDCFIVNDSICAAIVRVIDASPLSFTDYIDIREAFCDVSIKAEDRKLLDSCEQFYVTLDKAKPKKSGKSTDIRNYKQFLDYAAEKGFKGREDVLSFITQEDSLFRVFLTHLSSLGEDSLQPIRENSEVACRKVLKVPQSELSHDEVAILMTMRSNRRLLQNAEVCMTDIKFNRVRGKTQSAAYLWMLVQPFASLDDVSLAMLTNAQRVQLRQLAKDLPSLAKRMQPADGSSPIDTDNLPKLLTKAYILGQR